LPKDIINLINQNDQFLINYLEFFKNNSINHQYYNRIKNWLQNNNLDLKHSSEYISSLHNIGVIQTADLLTYLFCGRLIYSFEKIYKQSVKGSSDLGNEVVDELFQLINFLLLTNIFPPNDNIDHQDIGNGKYTDVHLDLRANLIDNILPKLIDILDEVSFMEFLQFHFKLSELKKISQIKCNSWNQFFSHTSYNSSVLKNHIIQNYSSYRNRFDYYCKTDAPPFLPKNVGLATEIFVYLFLMANDYGYVVPLLLHQRLFSNFLEVFSPNKNVSVVKENYVMVPTDFLLLKRGRVVALELGRGKPELISGFASISGIPTIFVDSYLNLGPKLGYKCNYCFNSLAICQKYIDNFKQGIITDIDCSDCSFLNTCNDKVYEYNFKDLKKHIHCDCYNQLTQKFKSQLKINSNPLPVYPEVIGLDKLRLGF